MRLGQVSEFTYLGAIFSEDGKLVKEFEERRRNAVASQLRSHVFNKKELSSDTKLAIHKSIFRPTMLFGSESWVDCEYLVHNLEVSDMNVGQRGSIVGTSGIIILGTVISGKI